METDLDWCYIQLLKKRKVYRSFVLGNTADGSVGEANAGVLLTLTVVHDQFSKFANCWKGFENVWVHWHILAE